MTKEKSTVPRLRFPGFTDAWKQRKLGEVLKERNESRSPSADVPLVSFTVENGVTPKTERYNREFLVRDENKKYKFTQLDDIVYNPANLKFGAIARNKYGAAVFSPIYVTYGVLSEAHPLFVELIVTSTNFIQRALRYQEGTVYERMAVKSFDLLRSEILLPALPEQEAIGNFFSDLDQLITLHQRKLDDVKELKKALLQKMFPKGNGNDFPELRFPEFTDAWKQRKLGEVSKRVTRRNKELISSLPLTISAQHGLVDQEEFFNKQVASKDVSSYYLIKKGEFAYNKSYSNGYPWGAIKRLDRYEMGVLSTLYIVFKPTSLICSDYLVSYYDTVNWYKEVSMIAAEGARNHGLLNIAPNDFFKTRLFIPTLPEQEAIGSFFSDLDQLITLHQRQLDHLKLLKKALLQQMFI
ncbi:Restriction endonuclease S subunit [Streptococcus suis]|uniref:Restriction endonuclease S subunit n=1 Tax=Streptococcus suis TaxID=1307 RepID=A0A116L2W8_STRSU|nr:restriction endonuclease subunit S [Streptococcus suis]NQH39723.1 restriction endonuclease subunit S [Streptococcus suis]CYU69192.1 Restriction endonuclease S subunit [Streptococcus suis]